MCVIEMDVERREFLKKAALAGIVTSISFSSAGTIIDFIAKNAEAQAASDGSVRGRKWVMIIDLKKCDGCKTCTTACQSAHFIPFNQEWIKVYDLEDAFHEEYFFPRPCMNCQNAPCIKVCPVGASYYNEDNVSIIDHRICIGCRMCMSACPYGARSFNWAEPPHTPEELAHTYSPEEPWPHMRGVPEKCDFCTTHASKGMLPPCILGCAPGALYFGDFHEDAVSNGQEVVKISDLIVNRQAYHYKEELRTKLSVYYLP